MKRYRGDSAMQMLASVLVYTILGALLGITLVGLATGDEHIFLRIINP